MTDDTIELIAAAMWREINGTTLSAKESRTMVSRYRKMARAALSAMPQQEVTVKDAENAALRKALEPFAKEAGWWFERNYNSSERVVEGFGDYDGEMTCGDLFRARAALSGQDAEGET